jgi:hypothetical protein
MNDFLFRPQDRNRFESTDVSVRIVSMVEIGEGKIESLRSLLLPISAQTTDALRNYEWEKDLFPWKNFVKNRE